MGHRLHPQQASILGRRANTVPARRFAAAGVVFWWVLAVGAPPPARAQVRPLVREMHENLNLVNAVGEGVALEDYERVTAAAVKLRTIAEQLRKFDVARLDADPATKPQFDAFLDAQARGARAIMDASKRGDGSGSLLALRQLFSEGCLACHSAFRDVQNLLPPAVLFMNSFLNSWKDINRGLVMSDPSLVARGAREIQSLGRVMGWDAVIESTFGLKEPEERQQFRRFLHRATAAANRVEEAAGREDIRAIQDATGRMWTDGCLACHEAFR